MRTEGKLVAPLDIEINTENPFYILTPKDKLRDQSIQVLKEWLLKEIKQSQMIGKTLKK